MIEKVFSQTGRFREEFKIPVEEEISIPKETNLMGVTKTVRTKKIEATIKLFKDNSLTTPSVSRITVVKRSPLRRDFSIFLSEPLVDGVDSELIFRDYDEFVHEYVITVHEKNIAIIGYIRMEG